MDSVRECTAPVAGRPCHYWVGGPADAPPLLLLHGGLGDAGLHWQHNFADLAPDFRVLAPDLPGFGRTAPLPRPSWPAYRAWVAAFCTAVGAERGIIAAGNSMGSAIARLFAAAYPARVAALVIVDGGRPVEVASPLRLIAAVPPLRAATMALLRRSATTDAAMRRYIADPAYLTPQVCAAMRQGLHAYIRVQSHILTTPRVPESALRVRCPVLVIWGAQDGLASPAVGRRRAAEVGARAYTVIDRAGHMPMFEQPAEFGRVLRDFLAGLPPGSAPAPPPASRA